MVVADAAFGHQAGGFVGQAAPAFGRASERVLLGVLSGVAHDDLRGWHDDDWKLRRDRNRRRRESTLARRE
ncbi:hypothetical protein GCM10027432_08680 [Lysobacter fragariae]